MIAPNPVAQTWPLAGRDELVATVADDLLGSSSVGVELRGEAGVGKTRLAEEVARCWERATGSSPMWVQANPTLADLPLGALLPILAPSAAVGTDLSPATVLTELLEGRGETALLVVDDTQWLDDESTRLVEELAEGGVCSVLATRRMGVPEQGHTGLARILLPIAVGPLERPAVERLLEELLGANLDPSLTAALWERSQGLPLFLHDLVESGIRSGAVVEEHGRWTFVADRFDPRATLMDQVVQRVMSESPGLQRTLRLVALAEPIHPEHLAAAAGGEAAGEAVRSALLALAAPGTLPASEEPGRLRFAHPLYGDVVRAGIGPLERRLLASDLARWRPGSDAPKLDRVLAASWQLEAGTFDPSQGVELSTVAFEAHRPALAIDLARAAYDTGLPGAAAALGLAHAHNGDPESGRSLLWEALDGDMDDISRAQVLRVLLSMIDDPDEARALVAHQIALLSEPTMEVPIQVGLGWSMAVDGLPAAAAESIEALWDRRAELDQPSRDEVTQLRLGCLVLSGRLEEVPDLVAAVDPERPEGPPAGWFAWLSVDRGLDGLARAQQGDLEGAALSAEIGRERRLAAPGAVQAWAHLAPAVVAHHQGRLGDAAGLYRLGLRSEQAMARIRNDLEVSGLLECAVLRGDRDLERYADQVLARRAAPGVAVARVAAARMWQSVAEGGLPGGHLAALRAAVDDLAARGTAGFELDAWIDLAMVGRPTADDLERVEALAGHVGGPRPQAIVELVGAVAGADPVAAGAAAGSLDGLGYRWEAARAWMATVRVARACRDRSMARSASVEARRLAEACGVDRCLWPPPPALAMLTERELQVVRLSLDGRTFQDVGGALGISARTAQSHFYRALERSGLPDRFALADELGI